MYFFSHSHHLARSIGQSPATLVIAAAVMLTLTSVAPASAQCDVTAKVVAMDQVITYNRMGAFAPTGMIFALSRDVFPMAPGGAPFAGPFTEQNSCAVSACSPGMVQLRPDKRPRPLTLRANEGQTICIAFTNLLNSADITDARNEAPGIQLCEPNDGDARPGTQPACQSEQPVTRNVGIDVHGLIPASIADSGSKVGDNASSLVAPGSTRPYTYMAEKEGAYVITSGPNLGGEGGNGATANGLFGVFNVEPPGSKWYRNQLTREEMVAAVDTAAAFDCDGDLVDETVGYTCGGQPVLNYAATFAGGDYAGLPILDIQRGNEIVHNELNAVIVGPDPGGTFGSDPAPYALYPNRGEAFREFTIAFHDEVKLVQAFPEWYNQLAFTLGAVKDGFAVNYGTGGIGSEIIGNRLGVGPMHECVECKYEEFFLTAWAVGDPAMIVDVPANAGLESCDPALNNCTDVGPKATKAFYPDDPSNVWHGYLNDRTKVRNIHVGTEHHVFHLHGHQWNFVNDDNPADQSNYLGAQLIGPGSSFTYEITYGGGGNRNKTPGDSIFQCHFYPHFAQGMWGLWRVHDTFERGSLLDAEGRVLERGLPDSEICFNSATGLPDPALGDQCGGYIPGTADPIAGGTPVPAVVPIPGKAMAPMPGLILAALEDTDSDGVPDSSSSEEAAFMGYPFYIPGVAGHRPPTPPLDLVADGGLPRHIITAGERHTEQTATDFDVVLTAAHGTQIPEEGTLDERVAMAFHGDGVYRSSFDTSGVPVSFEVNGLPPNEGSPYAEPCRGDSYDGYRGQLLPTNRFYAVSVIELDVDLNKVGWHFGQQRILTLDGDVADTLAGVRAPEPLVMRANSGDCVDMNHTNLVPNVYQLDDFQVKTPTDVIGQHIHLVKFDVTSADGAANGWNYEDGTFSPDEVHERMEALHAGSWAGTAVLPDATICGADNLNCARTTRQRWYIDPGWSGNVFTHDHYGPSTHQQAGLYATMLIEPKGSQWRDPATGTLFGSRDDGGPTSWRADILTAEGDAYREFYLEFADFQIAYRSDEGDGAGGGLINFNGPNHAINPSYRNEVGLPHVLQSKEAPYLNPTVDVPPGCGAIGGTAAGTWTGCAPEAISAADPGSFVVNYRHEPLALRARDPLTNSQALGIDTDGDGFANPEAGDLSYAFASVARADNRLNADPSNPCGSGQTPSQAFPCWPYGGDATASSGAKQYDPFTPILQVYEGDRVSVRVQVGAHEEGHNFSINGIRWLQNWRSGVSGFRNSQAAGISENFIFDVPGLGAVSTGLHEDYLYQTGSSTDARWNGSWGIMRAYDGAQGLLPDLLPLPTNPDGKTPPVGGQGGPPAFVGPCPRNAPERKYDIVAVRAADVLPGGAIQYHPELIDPSGLMYVMKSDLDKNGMLLPERRAEPLILRAAAGECVKVTLTNQYSGAPLDFDGFNSLPTIVHQFNNNQIAPSNEVGLHPQLVEYDISKSDGMNVGFNSVQTVAPGGVAKYKWYAGRVDITPGTPGNRTATPVEFGAINLMASDPIEGSSKGLIGALVILPENSEWNDGQGRGNARRPDGDIGSDGLLTRAAVTITHPGGSFRDFVVIHQDDVNMQFAQGNRFGIAAGTPVPTVAAEEEPEDSGQKGLNYRTDPVWLRLGVGPTANAAVTRQVDYTNAFAGTPNTPIYESQGEAIRLRILKPGGHNRNSVPTLQGHVWARYPYSNDDGQWDGDSGNFDDSQYIDPDNQNTFWHGEQMGHGPSNHINVVPLGGGCPTTGDYLYRDMVPVHADNGEWAIIRCN